MKEYYSVKETAEIMGVNKNSIYRWIKKGFLSTKRMGNGRHYIHYLEIPTFKRNEH